MPASFEDWLAVAFDHPASHPEWYWAEGASDAWEALELGEEEIVAYLTRLFLHPEALSGYSPGQVAQGIWFLLGESSPYEAAYALANPQVPLAARVSCVRSMADFFRRYVAVMAPGPARTDTDAFHTACYMWWDILPLPAAGPEPESELDAACVSAMVDCLSLPSDLCQISSLHGLNHWHSRFPVVVEQSIDRFLARGSVSPEVHSYALGARQGHRQ